MHATKPCQWSPDKIAQGDHNSSAPTCALHAISLLLTLGAGGALHTTTKCQDVVFLIVMFREGLHAHHAMQAIVVGVVGRSCCIVMIIKTSLHLVQNCIPFVWILLNCCPIMHHSCLHALKRLQSFFIRVIRTISFILWFVFVGHASFTFFHAWQRWCLSCVCVMVHGLVSMQLYCVRAK